MSAIPQHWLIGHPMEPRWCNVAYQLEGMSSKTCCKAKAWWDGEDWIFYDEPEWSSTERQNVIVWEPSHD